MKAAVLLLSFGALAACSHSSPYVTTVGILKPGSTLTVRIDSGAVNAYQPATNQRRDLFTVAATAVANGTPPPAPRLRAMPDGLAVRATGSLESLLVRVPDGVNLAIESVRGDVNVTDISGNVSVIALEGNVNVKVPGYAQASVGNGNLSVMMGAQRWPGTLRFSTHRGDIELWIIGRAAFNVHLRTDDGSLFSDFGLHGSSTGSAETIDGSVNGGSVSRIDARTSAGAIRLLRLQPQP